MLQFEQLFSKLLESTRNQINEVDMGRMCSIFGRDKYEMKGKHAYNLGNLGVDGRITLNSIIHSSGSR
jgi:hypothetical protein